MLIEPPPFAERLQSAVRLLSRIRDSFEQPEITTPIPIEEEEQEQEEGATTLANEQIITTTDGIAAIDDNEPSVEQVDGGGAGNFIHLRKCQRLDDWGPIGLNCTEEDIVTERVQVVGFLANWLHTYLYIRSEFQLAHSLLFLLPSCSPIIIISFPLRAGMSFGSFS